MTYITQLTKEEAKKLSAAMHEIINGSGYINSYTRAQQTLQDIRLAHEWTGTQLQHLIYEYQSLNK